MKHPGSWPHVAQCTGAFFLPIALSLVMVRVFLLTDVQNIGWEMFWADVETGKEIQFSYIFQTMIFWKLLVGAGLGAGVGWVAAHKVDATYRTPVDS